jgi:hypothetical protein
MKSTWSKTTIGTITVNVVMMLILFLNLNRIPPIVPLFFGNPTGGTQLAPSKALFLPSIAVIVITLLNRVMSYFIKDRFVDSVFVWVSIVLTLLSVVTTLKVMSLVGNF